MKFVKLHDEAVLPVGRKGLLVFKAWESIRIEPNGVGLVQTKITFKDMPEDTVLQLSLDEAISFYRPFLLASGIVTMTPVMAGEEITVLLYNRSKNIPAVIDEGEEFANGILLKHHTTDDTPKNTKTRSKKLQDTEKM